MKQVFIGLALLLLFVSTDTVDKKPIPSVLLTNLEGETVDTKTIFNDGNPILISFWATWCIPCMKELSTFAENYDDWQEETDVKIYAISIDDSRSSGKVAPFVNGQGWEFEFLLDKNQDFKRAMNVVNVPHLFLVDGQGNIIWQHTAFQDGDEVEILEKIKAVAKK